MQQPVIVITVFHFEFMNGVIMIHLSQNYGSTFSSIWWKKSGWEPAPLIRHGNLAALTYCLYAGTYEFLA